MARSVWDGSISFGLVNIPVGLVSAVRDTSIHFHILTKDGKCRLRQKLYCPETKREYDFSQTARGFEISPSNYVILDQDELKSLKPESGKTITIQDFVALNEVDPICFNRAYLLSPGTRAEKAYSLLAEAMTKTHKVAVAHFVMRQKEYLCIIRPMKGVLCLETLHFNEALVDASTVMPKDSVPHASSRELEVALQLIDSMTTKFDHSQYKDTYQKEVERLIKLKASGKKAVAHVESHVTEGAEVIDLMEALKKSLQQKSVTSKPRRAKASKRRA